VLECEDYYYVCMHVCVYIHMHVTLFMHMNMDGWMDDGWMEEQEEVHLGLCPSQDAA
jgi:hypothetical protein